MNIQDLILSIRQALSGGDTGGVVLVAVLVFLVLVVVIAAVLAAYARSARGRVDALLDERAGDTTASRWPFRVVMVLMFVGAAILARHQLFQPSQCARCHTSVDWAGTLAESSHAGVRCMACHGATGIAAPAEEAATYARWVVVNASQQEEPESRPGSVSSSDCLSCHGDVRRKTITSRGIRVRHADFLSEGSGCRDCHNSVAHGDAVTRPSEPGMNRCVVCHDGMRAPSECGYCHVEDPVLAKAVAASLPKIKTLETGNCYVCHDERPCLRCHGVTMPHPVGWAPGEGGPGQSGTHAREGFANRDVCWRCHFAEDRPFVPSVESCTCHEKVLGKMHGGKAWVTYHWQEATGVRGGETSECFMCHGDYLCDQCHPPSYKKRYNPQPGVSDYPRDIPYDPHYWEF